MPCSSDGGEAPGAPEAAAGATAATPAVHPILEVLRSYRFRHTPCYCEENVWRLCEDLLHGRPGGFHGRRAIPAPAIPLAGKLKVVFVSNASKRAMMWYQRAGRKSSSGAPGFVMWDYHCFAMLEDDELGPQVLDLDTMLQPFPVPFATYAEEALRPKLVSDLAADGSAELRSFRVIHAEEYLGTLCSDRSHMVNSSTGRYKNPPPVEPPILCMAPGVADGQTSNLFGQFVQMQPGTGVGEVLEEQAFLYRYGFGDPPRKRPEEERHQLWECCKPPDAL